MSDRIPPDGERAAPVGQHGSMRVSLLYLLLGDVAVVLALLGLVSRGSEGGVLLVAAVTVPLLAIGMLRPYLFRLAWSQQLRSWRASVVCFVAAGLGTAALAMTLGLGTLGHDSGALLSADDLGPVDELVLVPPSADFDAAASAVNAAVAVPEIRALVDADPLPIRRTMAIVSRQNAAPLGVQLLEFDTVRGSRFGGDPSVNTLPTAPLGASHAFATTDLAVALGLHPGSVLPPPLSLTIDGIVGRRGLTGLPPTGGERVPNLIVGPGTIDALRRGGWSAPVDAVLAVSNAGGSVDGVVYSDRVAAAIRGALANANEADGDVLFAPEPVDRGLDRVVVETVKASALRQEEYRRAATDQPLGLVSVVGATVAAGLISLALALVITRRRKDLSTMRTAGMSRSGVVSVQLIASWMSFLLPTLLGAVAGALLAQLAAGPAVQDVSGVATSFPRVDAGAALSFAWGLAMMVLTISAGLAAVMQVRSTVGAGRWAGSGAGRTPWGRTSCLVVIGVGVLMALWGVKVSMDALVVIGLSAVVLGIGALTGWITVLMALLPVGLVCAGRVGSLWRHTGAGASVSLAAAVVGGLVGVWWLLVAVGRSSDGERVARRLLVTRPFLVGSARPMLVAAAATLVAAAGVSGSLVAAASDLPGSSSQPVLVRSLAEPAVRAGDLQSVPGVGAMTELSLDGVDLSFDGGSQFVSARMTGGAEGMREDDLPTLSENGAWGGLLGGTGSVVLSPDIVPANTAVDVGARVVLRDRTSGRTLTTQIAGILDAPSTLASVWAASGTTEALTGAPSNHSILVVTPAPGVRRGLVASSLATALRGRPARVDTRATLADSRWPLAAPLVGATRLTSLLLWVVATLALLALVLRSLFERRRELRLVEPGLRPVRSIAGLLVRDTALCVVAGTAAGAVVGLGIGMRLVGRPAAPFHVVVPAGYLVGGPVITVALVMVGAVLATKWSFAHRAGRTLLS